MHAWQEGSGVTALPEVTHPSGTIVSSRHFQEIDVHEMQLSNGMRVTYKRTRFSDDEVRVSVSPPAP
jgi:hypothetical protein